MVGKNNKQARWSKSANTFKRYSLKKLSVGVASVVIGTGVAWASSTTVHAAEEGTEVVTGDGEKEEPVESAVPTEAPVVGGDESSSHDAVADLVNEISAAEEPASEAANAVEPRGANESSDNDYEPIPADAIEGAAETSDEEKDATSKSTSDDANELESDEEESRIQPRSSRPRAAREAEAAEADKLAGKYQPYVGSTLAKAQFKRVPEALDYIQNREDLKKDGQSVIKSAEWVDTEVFKKAGRQSTKIKVTYTDGSEDLVDIRLLINNAYKIGNQEYTGTKASEMIGLQTEKDGNINLGINAPDARKQEVRNKKSIEFEITTQFNLARPGRNEYTYFELSDNLARYVTSVVDTTRSQDSNPWERVRSHTGALTNTWRKKFASHPARAARGEALFNGSSPSTKQAATVRFDLKKTLGEIIKQENITKNSDIQAEAFVYNEDKARAKNGSHVHQNLLVKDRYGEGIPNSKNAADTIQGNAINSYFDKNIGPNGAFVFDHQFNKRRLNINNHEHKYQYHYKIDERLAPYISDTKVYHLNDGGSGLDFRENAENSDELRKVFENEGRSRRRNGWSGFEAQYNNGQQTNSWITKGDDIVENPQGHDYGIDRQLKAGEGYYRLTNWLANRESRQMNFMNDNAMNAGTRVAFLLKEGQTLDDVLRAFRGEKFTYEGYLKLTAKDGNVQPGTRGSGYYEVLDLDGDGRADETTPYDSNISIDTTYENANKITGSALSGIKSATSENANDGAPLSVYRVLKDGKRDKIGETKVKADGTYEISVPEGKQLQKDDVLEVEAVDNEGNTVRNRTTVLPLPDNQKYEPTGKNGEVPKNSQPVAENFINNTDTLPDNSKYDWEKPVDTSTTGEKDGTVIVTYPDGTQDKVNVKVTVVEGQKKSEEVEPSYKQLTITPGETVTTEAPTFDVVATADETETDPAPEGTTYKLGENPNLPDGVTLKINEQTGAVTITSSDNTPVGEFKVPVVVTYPDQSTDNAEVSVTVEKGTNTAEEVEPKYENPEPGMIESGKPEFHAEGNEKDSKEKPANTKFAKGDNPPAGFSYNVDPNTGIVRLEEDIPEDGITVPVKVTYEDGSTDTTNVTFTPKAPTAPVNDLGYPEEVTIEGTDEGSARTKETGQPNLPDAVNKADGDKFRFNKDVPEGFTHGNDNGTELVFNGGTADDPSDDVTLTIDPNTGNITVKGGDKADTRKPFDIPVEYVSKDDELKGSDVVTVQVKPKPEAKTPAPSIERAGDPTTVTEGKEKALEDKVKNPTDGMTGTITNSDGTEIPGGTVKVDGNTGEIKVEVPAGTVPEGQNSIPGKVQIKDNNGNDVGGPIDITIDKPEAKTPAPSIERAETPTHVTEGEEKALEDKVNNPTDGMTGTITNSDGTEIPGGTVTVDENTGEIKVQVPAGTVPEGQDSIPGKVQIKDKNGKDVDGPIDITIDKPEEKTPEPSIERAGNPTTVTEGTEKPLEDKVNNPTDGMTGTITNSDGTEIPGGTVTVDENTGEIKVQVPAGTVPEGQDSIPGKVQIKDKNGKDVDGPIDITIDKAKDETPAPSIERAETPTHVTEGEEKALEDKVNNPTDGMTGTITDGEGNEIQGGTVTVDGNTGEIKVQVPTNTVPEGQDSIPGKVQIKDNNGNDVGNPIDITIDKAKDETPAPSISGYEDKTITEGRPIEPITPEITNKGEGDITENGLPDGLNINPETGEITGTPDVKDWKDNFDKENPNSSDFEEERDFTVTVTVPGQPERTAEFTIKVQRDTDGDGTADVNDPDSDGDGINDNVELERGTNPKDANDFKGPELSVNTPKKGEETVSGKTEPQTSVTVKDTDGTVIGQGVSDEEGNFEVPVNRPLKGGEELDVTAGAPDNDKDQTTERVTVDTPDNEEYEPKWEDTNAEDGKRVVVPNTGDEIPAGSTTTATITEDPNNKGKANWTVTVDDNGDVEVTPGSDAQPGDSATVTVETTYPDGTKDSSSFKVTVPTIQSFEYDPQGQDIEVPEGAEPDAANGIANKDELPEGTEFEFDGPVDTSRPGKTNAKVIVAYPDGSTDTVDVTVNVTEVPTQADKYEPKGNPIFVEKNGTPNAADGIANKDELPEGTEFEFDGPVDTSTPGEKKAKVIVAYPDGSTDAVDVTVNVTDGDTPQSEIFEPQGQDIKVPEGGQPNAADGIANKDELPEGTEFEFDGPVDTSTPGKKKAKVIVAYPDGSTDTVDVTVNVTPKPTAETLEPKWNDSDAKDGGPVTVPNTGDKIPAGSTTTATITEDPNNKGKANWTVTVGEDGSVTVTPGADAQPGDSATVTVETTYPDGSKDSSSFKVTVPAVGPTHAHGDSLVHDKPSYDLDKLGHGQTQPSRPAEDKAQTPAVDKAGLPNYVPSQSGERLPDTATGAWVLGVVGLMSTGLGSALGLKRKKEDEE
ncbi:YSIRK-type signal peptide-containing protein [Dolosigranulum pigrum]|uniref:Rib/alpha-like domain-containing protein n=1 Tax=Dolosigranulum pigrum TaxID=29394 RepID=UPI00155E900F|nr:Rib/alpha-like domain-containing protein [Dolosigranulum pigrum]QJS95977.1 YSIRK-type signal peptide-containing protein [Dolosigranulum pigrum]